MVSKLFPCCTSKNENKGNLNKVGTTQKSYKRLTLLEGPVNVNLSMVNDVLISTRDDQEQLKKLPKNIMKFQRYNVVTF